LAELGTEFSIDIGLCRLMIIIVAFTSRKEGVEEGRKKGSKHSTT
jgi:hypothetical protein